jgi:hypothetical protein
MGLSLFNRRICNTYPGIIKTCDNTPITSTPKAMSDGVGNNVPLAIGTAGVDYTGTQDFSGATVIGLGVTSAGVVAGTGTSSFKVADALVSVPATASSIGAIALGDGMCVTGVRGIGIGFLNQVSGGDGIAIGSVSCAIGAQSIVLGSSAFTCAIGGTSIGTGAKVFPTGVNGTALGCNSAVCAINAVALGAAVTACCSCTVTACSMFLCVPSTPTVGGLLINDAGSTTRRLNITASGTLQIDGSPICADAGLVNDTGTCSIKVANDLVSSPAIASGACSIAIGNGSIVCSERSIGIGLSTSIGTCSYNSVVIGCGSFISNAISPYTNSNNVVIGNNAFVTSSGLFASCNVVIGTCANTTDSLSVVIGCGACSAGLSSLAIGWLAEANSAMSVAIGYNACVRSGASNAIAIGCQTNRKFGIPSIGGGALNSISIGCYASAYCTAISSINIGSAASSYASACYAISIGTLTCAYGSCDIVIGCNSYSHGVGNRKIAIGVSSYVVTNDSIAIGSFTCATCNCAVAIGYNVYACRANTLTTCELETCVAGCGLIVRTPDNTKSYRIAVDNSGNITTALA